MVCSGTVLVVGTGNELLSDEGFGVHVARRLHACGELPASVDVCETGTALLDLLPEMARHSRVIILDAVRTGREPGTLYRLEIVADSVRQADITPPISLHEWGIMETLRAAEWLGLMPQKLTLLGAEPETLGPGLRLSPRLADAAARIVEIILAELLPPSLPRAGS